MSCRLNIIYYQLKKCTMKTEITQELPCICIKFDPRKTLVTYGNLMISLFVFVFVSLSKPRFNEAPSSPLAVDSYTESVTFNSNGFLHAELERPPAPSWRILHWASSNRNDHQIMYTYIYIYICPQDPGVVSEPLSGLIQALLGDFQG